MLLQDVINTACEKSCESGQIVQVDILNNVFYFDAKAQKVYGATSLAIIRPLCLIQHDNQVSYSVKHDAFRKGLNFIINNSNNTLANKKQKNYSWDMQAFIWLIALWCSRRRIPQGFDITSPIFLNQWPNLSRLEPIPHAVRIAALIYEQPRTLTDVAKQLGIEQRYVFAFFSACKSIGIADISKRDVDKLLVSERPVPHKDKYNLSKLLKRLVNFPARNSASEIA